MVPLFWSRSKARSASAAILPGAGLEDGSRFDPHLRQRIMREHAELLRLFRRLLDAAQNAQLEQVSQDLVAFRHAFMQHLQIENVKFYSYLERRLADKPRQQQSLHKGRREANLIAKTVGDFIHIWVTVPPTDITLPAFAEQLKSIGTQLVQRIELEESVLLPMYS